MTDSEYAASLIAKVFEPQLAAERAEFASDFEKVGEEFHFVHVVGVAEPVIRIIEEHYRAAGYKTKWKRLQVLSLDKPLVQAAR
jgi:hypothetical protein